METQRTIKAGVEMREDLHARVKAEAARRRVKMKDAVEQAFAAWLKEENHSKNYRSVLGSEDNEDLPRDPSLIPPVEFEPWVSYLLHILRENNPFAAPSIKKNLEAFERLTNLDGGRHAPPPGEDIEAKTERLRVALEDANQAAEDYLGGRDRGTAKRGRVA